MAHRSPANRDDDDNDDGRAPVNAASAADASSTTGFHAVSPAHVLLLGGAALGSGAAITATLAYREAGKRLRADGIDPRARRAVLPVALRAAGLSLALTAAAAAGGFWLLRELGAVGDAPVAMPSPGEAWRALRAGGGDGSTLESVSAAWRRREAQAAGAAAAAAAARDEGGVGMERQEGQQAREAASAGAQHHGSASGWWWWRRGRRRDDADAPALPPSSRST